VKRSVLEGKTVVELRALARDRGATELSKLRKAELVDLLLAVDAAPRGSESVADRAAQAAEPSRPTSMAGAKAPRGGASGRRGQKPEEIDERWEALSPRTHRAFSAYRTRCEQRIKASKYYLGVPDSPELDEGFEYPESYGESAITLMVRDPYWLFAYWELSPHLRGELLDRIGEEDLARSRLVLRVYDVTRSSPDRPASIHDIDVAPGARNWYINVMRVERDYCVDLGIITPGGTFIVIARSNVVSLPPVGPSEVVDEEWVTLEALGELYARVESERGPSSGSGGWGSGGWGR